MGPPAHAYRLVFAEGRELEPVHSHFGDVELRHKYG